MTKESRQVLAISLAASLIASLVFGCLAGYLGARSALSNPGFLQNSAATSTRQLDLIGSQSAIVSAVDNNSPAVVSIIITKDLSKINLNNPLFNDPLFRQLFGDQFNQYFGQNNNGSGQQEIGGGTGFIVSSDGYIVTNKHVVADTEADYTVLLDKNRKLGAKVLDRDPVNDLAIIKIEATNLPTVQLGDSSNLKVGQTVIAIGNALGEFRNTVSVGVISGLARSIMADGVISGTENLVDLIQTDASINPGNSGGPLLDINGLVIGIDTAMVQGGQGIGFAIPINEAKKTIESIKVTGHIARPWLGVRILQITKDLQAVDKLPVDYGALIMRGQLNTDLAVVPGSPADKAGLVENDIILEVEGVKVTTDNPLPQLIAKYQVGQVISLKVMHRGKEALVRVKLEEAK